MTDIDRQIAELTALLKREPDNADALYRRGALHWKLGRHAAALSDFNASAAVNPDGPGATAARGVRGILDFTNPDLLNP